MLCVIAGHLGSPEVNSVVFTFHLPVFLLVAGYYFRPQEPGLVGIAKRARRLLVPYLYCAVACSLGAALVSCLTGDPGASWVIARDLFVQALFGSGTSPSPILGIPQFGAAWFLPAMFFALVIYDWINDRRWTTPAVAILFVAGNATRGWWLPLSVQASLCALAFIHVGWLARHRTSLSPERIPLWLVGLSAVAWTIAFVLDAGKMYLVTSYFTNIPLDVLGGIAGSLLLLFVSGLLAKVPLVSRGLAAFGRDSLTVLCLHMIDLRVIPWNLVLDRMGASEEALGHWPFILVMFALKVAWAVLGLLALRALGKARTRNGIEIARTKGGKPRIRSFDVAKGVAIILVIVAHVPDVDQVVNKLVFSFHMPFFFLVNAAFVGRAYDAGRTFKRSLRTLLVPYAVVCLLAAGLTALVTPQGTKAAVVRRLVAMLGGMSKTGDVFQGLDSVWLVWFVACLFVARNVYVVVRQATQRRPVVGYIALLALSALGLWLGRARLWLPWSVDVALYVQIFMLVGDEARRRGVLDGEVPVQGVVCLTVAWVALALGGFQLELAMRKYPGLGVLCAIDACLGSWLLLLASRRLESLPGSLSRLTTQGLEWAGKCSMVILGAHCLRMMWAGLTTNSIFFCTDYPWQINAGFEVAFCLALTFVWERAMAWWRDVRSARRAYES